MAGVVGLKKPRYDIFGETVNIAKHLEETCTGKLIKMVIKRFIYHSGDSKRQEKPRSFNFFDLACGTRQTWYANGK